MYGWQPIVLTVKEKYYDSSEGFLDYSLLEDVETSMKIFRTEAFQPWSRWRTLKPVGAVLDGEKKSRFRALLKLVYQMAFVPDDKLFWLPYALRQIRRILASEPVDSILATTPYHSTGLIGAFASSVWRIPFVLDIRDDWVGNPLWWSGQYWHRRVLDSWLERWMVKRSSAVVAVTRESRAFILEKYPWKDRAQVHYLPNGFDPEDFEADNGDISLSETDRPKIVYVGGVTRRRDPTNLFLAMARARQSQPAFLPELHFVGSLESRWLSMVEALGLSADVYYHGPVEHGVSIQFVKAASACLLFSPQDDGCRTVVPGKLYEYLAARKPVLAITPRDSATAHLLDASDIGWVADPENVSEIEEALLAVAGDEGRVPRKWKDWEAFDRRALVGQLAGILGNLRE